MFNQAYVDFSGFTSGHITKIGNNSAHIIYETVIEKNDDIFVASGKNIVSLLVTMATMYVVVPIRDYPLKNVHSRSKYCDNENYNTYPANIFYLASIMMIGAFNL